MLQHGQGLRHADAGIGDRHTVAQGIAFAQVLAPFVQVAFNHDAGDARVTGCDLPGHVGGHVNLPDVLLAAVGMRKVDHDLFTQAAGGQHLAGGSHMFGVVVGGFAAAQDDVAVVVAACFKNGGLSHLGHANKGMGRLGGHHGIDRHLDVAVGAVLESHRAAHPAGKLPVRLAFGGARADGAPGNQVADELGAEQVQKLGAGRQAQFDDVQQQLPRTLQPVVDGKTAVQMGVVDIPFPAHRGARFFKIHAHDDEQFFLELLRHLL